MLPQSGTLGMGTRPWARGPPGHREADCKTGPLRAPRARPASRRAPLARKSPPLSASARRARRWRGCSTRR
eukprot:14436472-Alexandrium_andersonii.AAC.1